MEIRMALAKRNWITAGTVMTLASSMLAAQSSHDPDPAIHQVDPLPTQTFSLIAHPVVALTFDDLPGGGKMPAGMTRTEIAVNLAAVLKANHLEGTYGFVNARGIENVSDEQQALQT